MRRILITGTWGLVGFECAKHFLDLGWKVLGIDNDMRAQFFGPEASGLTNHYRLFRRKHYEEDGRTKADIRDANRMQRIFSSWRPDAIIHAAAQPAHQYGQNKPVENWAVNVTGTLNLLEAARLYTPDSPFVFMSSSKVYGTSVNEHALVEGETRYKYFSPILGDNGFNEDERVDMSFHTQYGASKLAADQLVQEYSESYHMPTICLRAGCMTGSAHGGVPMHGFLSHLTKQVVRDTCYVIEGYGGKQVRDQLHASDVARACELFISQPCFAGVYNLGGGPDNSISILEAIQRIEEQLGRPVNYKITPKAREGDQVIVVNNNGNFRRSYRDWNVKVDLDDIFAELLAEASLQSVAAKLR